MRNIQELLQADRKIWFCLKDRETAQSFVEALKNLGAEYVNGSQITLKNCSSIMVVYGDRKVAHLSPMIWCASFLPDFQERYRGNASKILKVDYARYLDGGEDYIVQNDILNP